MVMTQNFDYALVSDQLPQAGLDILGSRLRKVWL